MSRLSDILELTPEHYAERFRQSAMKRAKLTGLQRNARALQSTRRQDTRGQDSRRPRNKTRSPNSDVLLGTLVFVPVLDLSSFSAPFI